MKQLNFNTQLNEITFTVVDTETTGQRTEEGGEMIEIAAVCIRPGFILDLKNIYSSLIKTNAPILPGAQMIHNITVEMLSNAPDSKTVIKQFASFVQGSILVAHNARFDCKYIYKAYRDNNVKINISHVFDSVAIARKLYPKLESHSLDSMIDFTGVYYPRPGIWRHRALYDADHTALIFLQILKELDHRGYYTLGDLYEFIS